VSLGLADEVLDDQKRLARVDHVLHESLQRKWFQLQALTAFDHVRIAE